MTVKEYIDALSKLPQDLEVLGHDEEYDEFYHVDAPIVQDVVDHTELGHVRVRSTEWYTGVNKRQIVRVD